MRYEQVYCTGTNSSSIAEVVVPFTLLVEVLLFFQKCIFTTSWRNAEAERYEAINNEKHRFTCIPLIGSRALGCCQ
jgi:hypothetical protein